MGEATKFEVGVTTKLGEELVDIIGVLEAFGVPKETIAMVLVEKAGLRMHLELSEPLKYLEAPQQS